MAGRFPLLLDEHVPRSFAHALRQRGWTVVRVVDLKTELGLGADDEQVFSYASQQGYVVFSSDERALWRPQQHRQQGDPFPGMLCWPQRHRDRMTIGEAVEVLERMALEDDPSSTGTASSSRPPREPARLNSHSHCACRGRSVNEPSPARTSLG